MWVTVAKTRTAAANPVSRTAPCPRSRSSRVKDFKTVEKDLVLEARSRFEDDIVAALGATARNVGLSYRDNHRTITYDTQSHDTRTHTRGRSSHRLVDEVEVDEDRESVNKGCRRSSLQCLRVM